MLQLWQWRGLSDCMPEQGMRRLQRTPQAAKPPPPPCHPPVWCCATSRPSRDRKCRLPASSPTASRPPAASVWPRCGGRKCRAAAGRPSRSTASGSVKSLHDATRRYSVAIPGGTAWSGQPAGWAGNGRAVGIRRQTGKAAAAEEALPGQGSGRSASVSVQSDLSRGRWPGCHGSKGTGGWPTATKQRLRCPCGPQAALDAFC